MTYISVDIMTISHTNVTAGFKSILGLCDHFHRFISLIILCFINRNEIYFINMFFILLDFYYSLVILMSWKILV